MDECDQEDISDIIAHINIRFGTTRIQKLKQYEALKQKPNETVTQYADRIRKAAIGLERHPEDLVFKFLTTITASSAVHDDIINLRPKNLQEAVAYVESHSKGGSSQSNSSEKSPLKCSICKRVGHTAKTCRRGKAAPQRAKKVDEVEAAADVEEC